MQNGKCVFGPGTAVSPPPVAKMTSQPPATSSGCRSASFLWFWMGVELAEDSYAHHINWGNCGTDYSWNEQIEVNAICERTITFTENSLEQHWSGMIHPCPWVYVRSSCRLVELLKNIVPHFCCRKINDLMWTCSNVNRVNTNLLIEVEWCHDYWAKQSVRRL